MNVKSRRIACIGARTGTGARAHKPYWVSANAFTLNINPKVEIRQLKQILKIRLNLIELREFLKFSKIFSKFLVFFMDIFQFNQINVKIFPKFFKIFSKITLTFLCYTLVKCFKYL